MRKPVEASRETKGRKSSSPKPLAIRGETARPVYPFTAIVGQEEMKLALLLNVIDPLIGGVIVMGHRGTAKSTAVRALADLLPRMPKVKGCFYGCDPKQPSELCDECYAQFQSKGRLPFARSAVPVVDLPLGATEDRVCGALDIERALVEGVKAFEPGLLARANRGFLYIDEVNLLDDHLVDLLLDAAASGRNVVEREGISISHPSRFVLVGSGNPEEGELRPQLLDRFGLYTQIATLTDLDDRVEIVERRERFERSPAALLSEFDNAQEQLKQRLVKARNLRSEVSIDRGMLRQIAELCIAVKIDGHRGELTIARAARALAAFEERKHVLNEDVIRVSVMSLRHRLRKDPLERIETGKRIEQAVEAVFTERKEIANLAAIR
jgi:magnesium chelatase subunit I